MGQQVFIPHSGGGAGSAGAVFITDLLDDVLYCNYGLLSGADIFYPGAEGFLAVIAFRVVQDDPTTSADFPVIQVNDDSGGGWRIKIFGSVYGEIAGTTFSGGGDLPLGRVFIVTLMSDAVGNSQMFVNGLVVSTDIAAQNPLTQPVQILVGPSGSTGKDFVEYIGFGFMRLSLTPEEVASIYTASQDAGRVVFPAAIAANPHVIYNAATGLSNLALWVPESNTLGAPDLPAIDNGIATGTLLTAPFRVAQSGWAADT